MSTHNVCFCGEIRKLSAFFFDEKSALSVAMTSAVFFPLIQEGQLPVSGERMSTSTGLG